MQDAGFTKGEVNVVKNHNEFDDDYGVEKYEYDITEADVPAASESGL